MNTTIPSKNKTEYETAMTRYGRKHSEQWIRDNRISFEHQDCPQTKEM